jgi:hypothetical protein
MPKEESEFIGQPSGKKILNMWESDWLLPIPIIKTCRLPNNFAFLLFTYNER